MRFEVKKFNYNSIFPSGGLLDNEGGYAVWDNHYNSWYRAKGQSLKVLNTKAEALEYLHSVQEFESCGIVKAVNIQWDIDSRSDLQFLPTEIMIPTEVLNEAKENDDAISDYITDVTGFCHRGFDLVECEVTA